MIKKTNKELKKNSLKKHISKELFPENSYLKEDLNEQLKAERLKVEKTYSTTLNNFFINIEEYGKHIDQINNAENSIDLIIKDEENILEQLSKLKEVERILKTKYYLSNQQIKYKRLIGELAHDIGFNFFTQVQDSKEELKNTYSGMQVIGKHVNLLATAKKQRLKNEFKTTKINLEELKELIYQSLKYYQKINVDEFKKINFQLEIKPETKLYASKAQIYDFLINGVKNEYQHGKSTQITITLEKESPFNSNNIYYARLIIQGNGPTKFPVGEDLCQYGMCVGPTSGTGKGMSIMNDAIKAHNIKKFKAKASMEYKGKRVVAKIPQLASSKTEKR